MAQREADHITVFGFRMLSDGYSLHVPQGYGPEPHPGVDHAVTASEARALAGGASEGRCRWPADDEIGPHVFNEPVRLDGDMIDAAIQRGSFTAGIFNGYKVLPSKDLWPDRWLGLKTDLLEGVKQNDRLRQHYVADRCSG